MARAGAGEEAEAPNVERALGVNAKTNRALTNRCLHELTSNLQSTVSLLPVVSHATIAIPFHC
jgi:hypothetical protein